jgi:hypothetical protein
LHIAADDFVRWVADIAENEGFPEAWTNTDALRSIATTFAARGGGGGAVQWRKVLHSAMYAILPRPPSTAELVSMLETLAPPESPDARAPRSAASLPDKFYFWFESDNAQQQANPPAPPNANYPGQGWGAGGEARELYLTMFTTPDTGAVNVEKLMLLLCCWQDTQESKAADDILGVVETRASLGLARACLITSAFHSSMPAAKHGMKQILEVYGEVFETSQMHTRQFDSADRLVLRPSSRPSFRLPSFLPLPSFRRLSFYPSGVLHFRPSFLPFFLQHFGGEIRRPLSGGGCASLAW